MIGFFLKLKHWQLFLLMFAIPFSLQMGLAVTVFVEIFKSAEMHQQPNPEIIFSSFRWIPLFVALFMGFQLGWFWSIAIGLQKKIPKKVRMKVGKFKALLFIPVVYFIALFGMFSNFISNFSLGIMPDPRLLTIGFAVFIPLHFFAIFCLLYSMYFAAKTFKTAELQREVAFKDFAGEFFLLWFYVVGVWILQPKINQMAQSLAHD